MSFSALKHPNPHEPAAQQKEDWEATAQVNWPKETQAQPGQGRAHSKWLLPAFSI